MKDLINYFGELEYEKYIDEHPKSELSFKEFMKDYKIQNKCQIVFVLFLWYNIGESWKQLYIR